MFHYQSCGLPDIWLKNGFEEIDTGYGKSISIHDIEGLHRALGLNIIDRKPMLESHDIRFLRKELDMPQTQLAHLLGVSENTVRAWENDRQEMNNAADRILRLLYSERVRGDGAVYDLVERIGQLNREAFRQERLELEETSEGWRAA